MMYTLKYHCVECPEICYKDGATTLYFYTKGEVLEKRACSKVYSKQINYITLLNDKVITFEEGAKRLAVSVEELEAMCTFQDA